MVRPKLDWKNQPGSIVDWLIITIAVVLLPLYLYLWWMGGQSPYLVMAIVFLAWLAVFFTDYWQPILYLIMVILIVIMLVLGVLGEFFEEPIGQTALLLNIVFLLVIVYLYYSEETGQQKAESDQ